MHQIGPGQPAFDQSSHPVRLQPVLLATPLQRSPPIPADTFKEQAQARQVPWHRVVLEVPGEYTPEPLVHRRNRTVHPRSQRLRHCLQFRLHAFAYRSPVYPGATDWHRFATGLADSHEDGDARLAG
jgi:hypothetical protein